MKDLKIGDRVETDFLGEGEIVKTIESALDKSLIIAYMVKFDTTPPERYNCGANPCIIFPYQLNKIKDT